MQEGRKFEAALQDMMTWVQDKQQVLQEQEPVSGQKDKLSVQKRQHEVRPSEGLIPCVQSIERIQRHFSTKVCAVYMGKLDH